MRRLPKLHPESLLNVPLVRQMLEDKQTKLIPRAVDNSWQYQKVFPTRVTGFHPALGIFYAQRSRFASWLRNPAGSARKHNLDDELVADVLVAVHDYIHCWAYLAINELMPKLGLGTRPITRKNVEDLVFAHLVTEAAAVIGLDYWYLSTVELNKVCDIGTARNSFAVAYHERHAHEYVRFNPHFVVQRPQFFIELCDFYCTGNFVGFDAGDIRQSPLLLAWLRHEIRYGRQQREFMRQWFAYLSHDAALALPPDLGVPVPCQARWQRKLLGELGELLWDKVKKDVRHRFSFRFDPKQIWRSDPSRRPDFRFLNANAFRGVDVTAIGTGPNADVNFQYFIEQYASQFEYAGFDEEIIKLLPNLKQLRDARLLEHLFSAQKRIPYESGEPRDLFVIN